EQIRHRAHLHWVAFLPAYLITGLTVVLAIVALRMSELWYLVAPLGLVAAVMLLVAFVTYRTSEFAVTDRRVIIKVGWIKRRTLETMLSKVEAVGVDQGLLGRLLGFGTITVTGTGGTQEQFERIAAPLEFRKSVQAEALGSEDRSARLRGLGVEQREERECPYCAERILVRARVCRFCGREVPPVTA
ncbi:MAG: PH domain-containing protein, partial [Gemmatimonadales bacterium]